MINLIRKRLLSNKKLRKKIISFIRNQQKNSFKIENFPAYSKFTTGTGEEISLHKNLRNFVNPNWEDYSKKLLKNKKLTLDVTDLQNSKKDFSKFLETFNHLIKLYDFDPNNKKILEIGSGNTLLAHCFQENYPESNVLSSDIKEYYDEEVTSIHINESRELVSSLFKKKVAFEFDDITHSKFPDNSVDCILSYTVLEHVNDIEKCFKEIYRLLKKGGISYHIYNPFFGYNGAHSLSSNDHPWGHCSLSEADYTKLMAQYYKDYLKLTLNFYHNNLNKQSILQFHDQILNAGFTQFEIIPEVNTNVLNLLVPYTLKNTKQNYPTATITDLLSSSVIIFLKK